MLLRTITEEGRLYMIEDKRNGFNGKSTAWIESWKMSRSKIGRDAKVRWWHCPGRCKYAQWLLANEMVQNAFGCVRYEWMNTHTRWVCNECWISTHMCSIMPSCQNSACLDINSDLSKEFFSIPCGLVK